MIGHRYNRWARFRQQIEFCLTNRRALNSRPRVSISSLPSPPLQKKVKGNNPDEARKSTPLPVSPSLFDIRSAKIDDSSTTTFVTSRPLRPPPVHK